MGVFQICGILLLCLFLSMLLREVRPSFAALFSALASLFCLVWAIGEMKESLSFLSALAVSGGQGAYFEILLKALGIGILSGMLAEICRDVGEGALSRGAELMGKGAMLALAFPLFEDFVSLLNAAVTASA